MKKTALTLLFGLLMQLTYAQDKPEMPTCVIVNGALNLTSLEKYDYFYSSKANPGFSGGAMIRTNGDFYVMTGLQYVSVNPTMTNKTEMESEKVNLQFLQLPLMGGFQIVKSHDSKQTMHAQLGASFSSLLSVSENSIGINEDNLRKTGFTFKAGIGADLWMFTADINYNLLLSHVYDNPGYDNKTKLMCWEFSLGWKFNLGKKEVDDSE